jgi:stress-induced-phosphoprotein 1
MGNAYEKLNDLPSAIKYLQKSLTEHRTPDTLTRLRNLESLKKTRDIESYRSPELSDAARERGNAFFKQGNFVEGVKEYTEAIKRNDKDARNFSNA